MKLKKYANSFLFVIYFFLVSCNKKNDKNVLLRQIHSLNENNPSAFLPPILVDVEGVDSSESSLHYSHINNDRGYDVFLFSFEGIDVEISIVENHFYAGDLIKNISHIPLDYNEIRNSDVKNISEQYSILNLRSQFFKYSQPRILKSDSLKGVVVDYGAWKEFWYYDSTVGALRGKISSSDDFKYDLFFALLQKKHEEIMKIIN